MKAKPFDVFLLDVDGVMTDGSMYYSSEGKFMKRFGPDDHDGLSLLKPFLDIFFISGDKRGFSISEARIKVDMQMPLELVSTVNRVQWVESRWDPKRVIYMADGIFDPYVFRKVGYAIAPSDADLQARKVADYVTERSGGNRAVAEASLHLLEKFFQPFDSTKGHDPEIKFSGIW